VTSFRDELRAESSSSEQPLASEHAQLACIDELPAPKENDVATKGELLTSPAAHQRRCQELLQHSAAPYQAAAADSCKQQRLAYSSTADLALGRDDVLDDVFSFVGGGDHLYTGGVSRRWRSLYMQYCAQTNSAEVDKKLVTRHRSVLMTESRLQLALSSGLSVEGWTFDKQSHAELICLYSVEPEKVLALLRVHGVPWSTLLCEGAAYYNKLTLLQWLLAHSCPWDIDNVLHRASARGYVAMLDWLFTVTAPWSIHLNQALLSIAASLDRRAAMQWLTAHGADWPTSFSVEIGHNAIKLKVCWCLAAVQWALASGSGWLDWKCEDYAADQYGATICGYEATILLEWAHANGCPCTCGHVQQQQQ
jgi:hypothetical protein